MRQICVRNAAKIRGTRLEENTFCTIPILAELAGQKPFEYTYGSEFHKEVVMQNCTYNYTF